MKSVSLNSSVLTGTGGGGSWSVGVPTITPGVGPTSGDKTLSTQTGGDLSATLDGNGKGSGPATVGTPQKDINFNQQALKD